MTSQGPGVSEYVCVCRGSGLASTLNSGGGFTHTRFSVTVGDGNGDYCPVVLHHLPKFSVCITDWKNFTGFGLGV